MILLSCSSGGSGLGLGVLVVEVSARMLVMVRLLLSHPRAVMAVVILMGKRVGVRG